ncbi:MAG: DUF454 family protein [Planctomycetota bacterium]|nr:MAG: DUF454 family protein [Planctomycetota bacterium]
MTQMDENHASRRLKANDFKASTKINGTNGHHGPNGFHKLNGHDHSAYFLKSSETRDKANESGSRMDWVESLGLFVLHDKSVIQRTNRRFCSRLVHILAKSHKVRLAHVHLLNHELIVHFSNPKTERAEAARILGDAIRLATIPMPSEIDETGLMAPRWSGFTAFSSETGAITIWRMRELGKNRLRLYGESIEWSGADPSELLTLIPSLKSVQKGWLGNAITIKYDPDQIRALDLVGAIDTICRLEAVRLLPDEDENPLASKGLVRRFWHLCLAGGCMTMAVVGLIVPGIPTVPFILLTSYHLARGSQSINHYFLRLPFVGSVAHDWSDGRYIRIENKLILISITSGIIGVTLLLTPLTPGLFMLVGVVFTITTVSILRTPNEPQMGMIPKVGISRGLRSLPAMG